MAFPAIRNILLRSVVVPAVRNNSSRFQHRNREGTARCFFRNDNPHSNRNRTVSSCRRAWQLSLRKPPIVEMRRNPLVCIISSILRDVNSNLLSSTPNTKTGVLAKTLPSEVGERFVRFCHTMNVFPLRDCRPFSIESVDEFGSQLFPRWLSLLVPHCC